MLYDWLKALHVVAVISWMAGLLYLPRLFVYHTAAAPGGEASETFKAMERRLLKAIMTPAMAVTWLTGLTLAWWGGWYQSGWFHLKFVAVVLMSIAHEHFASCARDFAADANTRSQRYYRFMNEAPTLLMIAIVIAVIVKPF